MTPMPLLTTAPSPASTTPALSEDGSGFSSGSGDAPSRLPDTAPLPTVQWGVPDAVQDPVPSVVPSATATATATAPQPIAKPRAGRRPGAVWNYFTPLRTEQNKTHAVCRFCTRRCAGVAARMAAHVLTKCPSVPAHDRDALAAALAHEGPPEKRQRLENAAASSSSSSSSSASSGLAAFAGTVHTSVPPGSAGDTALTSALQLVVVACLRSRVPLTLIEDPFFRDALTLLRPPQSLAAIHAIDATALRASVAASVTQEASRWLRTSESVTFQLHSVAREWRVVDRERHGALLAEASLTAWRAELETQLSLVGVDAVVGLCCDARHVYGDVVADKATAAETVASRITLVSKCLLTETARLWTRVVDVVPSLASVVAGAAEVAQTYAAMAMALPSGTAGPSPQAADELALFACHDLVAADWSLPFRVVKRLDALGHTLKLLETDTTKSARAVFWNDLSAVAALLSPFAWLLALSESNAVGASTFTIGWLWLLATIEQSSLVGADGARQQLVHVVLTAVMQTLEDHHLVALLLDPRTRGAGLSATGRRKVKTLVVRVATRVWPTKFHVHPPTDTAPDVVEMPTARHALLTQLGHYMDKTGCFADDVVWEMASGAPPERFWRDYVQDAPELTALAMAVLTFVPVTSPTGELLRQGQGTQNEASVEPLDARRICFHYERNRKHGACEMATVLTTYAELLGAPPSVSLPVPVPSAPSVPSVPSLNLVDAVGAALERLRAVSSSDDEGTTTTTTDGTTVVVEDMDTTWFAFQSESDRYEIDAARRRVVPTAVPASPPAPAQEPLLV